MPPFVVILCADGECMEKIVGEALVLASCRFYRNQFKETPLVSLAPSCCIIMASTCGAEYVYCCHGAPGDSGAFGRLRHALLSKVAEKRAAVASSSRGTNSMGLFSALLKASCFLSSKRCQTRPEVFVLLGTTSQSITCGEDAALDVASSTALVGLVGTGAAVSACGPECNVAYGGRLLQLCRATGGIVSLEFCHEFLNFGAPTERCTKSHAQQNYVVDPQCESEAGEFLLCSRCFTIFPGGVLHSVTCPCRSAR